MGRMNSLMLAPEPELQDALATTLLANHAAFQGFVRRRFGDNQLAADAVQESLLRALRSERSLSQDENLVAWFYRILRNVLTDLHRGDAAQARGLERFADELAIGSEDEADVERTAAKHGCLDCQCDTNQRN